MMDFYKGIMVGFLAFPSLIGILVMLSGKRPVVGYAKTAREAADRIMPMINSNDELREEIKNRLGID